MCAINGVFGDNTEVLETMILKTKHRGPDATGVFSDQNVSLGHNRLSILDLSDRSNQPFISPDGRYVLVYNGEIYNYRQLRETVTDYKFVTDSDTEVLLAVLMQDGENALGKLNGIFAFAFWDNQRQELFLVRDKMGVKPLYYALQENNFYFSSELAAISEACSIRNIHPEALSSYLYLGYSLPDNTVISGVHKIPPGCKLKYKKGREPEIVRYWYPDVTHDEIIDCDSVRGVIAESVVGQLVSDRPVGLTLSGGLDSTIILHHAHDHVANIRTFSSYFEPTKYVDDKFNHDAELAKRTAAHYSVPHTMFKITANDVKDNIEKILQNQSEPVANPTAITRYLLYKKIRDEGIVVVLGGDGGDELFGGYARYQRVMLASYFQMFPKFLRDVVSGVSGKVGDLNLPLQSAMHLRLMAQKKKHISAVTKTHNLSSEYITKIFDKYYETYQNVLDPVKRFMLIDRETWLSEESLIQTDINSMQHAIEARVPFLDTRVVELADKIPSVHKLSLFDTKKILRKSYKDHIPEFIFDQPKRGWQSPGAKWFREPGIKEFVEEVFSESYYDGLSGFVEWDKVRKLFDDHVERRSYHLYPLWNLLQLQVWARKHKIRVK